MSQRKKFESLIIEQMQANGGLLTLDVEYASFEYRRRLDKMEEDGLLQAISSSSDGVVYRLITTERTPRRTRRTLSKPEPAS